MTKTNREQEEEAEEKTTPPTHLSPHHVGMAGVIERRGVQGRLRLLDLRVMCCRVCGCMCGAVSPRSPWRRAAAGGGDRRPSTRAHTDACIYIPLERRRTRKKKQR